MLTDVNTTVTKGVNSVTSSIRIAIGRREVWSTDSEKSHRQPLNLQIDNSALKTFDHCTECDARISAMAEAVVIAPRWLTPQSLPATLAFTVDFRIIRCDTTQ